MIDWSKRWLAAQLWNFTGRPSKNRDTYYGGEKGLRVITFHDTAPEQFARFQRVVEWATDHLDTATPEDADALFRGVNPAEDRDQVLFTFDDGLASNHAAGQYLAARGIRAIFFVVPTLIDRTASEFIRYHRRRGVEPFPLEPCGLSGSQIRDLLAMGHRIAAHNNAHRDLGRLSSPADLDYEIKEAVHAVSEITGTPCRDFAFAFGQPSNLSPEASRYLRDLKLRTWACCRGLNAPGISPRFLLRHGFEYHHPEAFTRLSLVGGMDHTVYDRQRQLRDTCGTLPKASHPDLENQFVA